MFFTQPLTGDAWSSLSMVLWEVMTSLPDFVFRATPKEQMSKSVPHDMLRVTTRRRRINVRALWEVMPSLPDFVFCATPEEQMSKQDKGYPS